MPPSTDKEVQPETELAEGMAPGEPECEPLAFCLQSLTWASNPRFLAEYREAFKLLDA